MANEELIQSIVGKLVQNAYWANQVAPRPIDRLAVLPAQRPAEVCQFDASKPAVVAE